MRTKTLIEDTLFLMAIMDRTQEVDGCLEWTGPIDSYGVPITRRTGSRKLIPVRRTIFNLNGREPGTLLATYKCTNALCLRHIGLVTRKTLQIRTAKTTNYAKSPARRKAISMKRRETAKLTEQIVADMRASGLTTREAGERWGVAQSTAAAVMGHRTWRDYSNPFAALMA